MVEEVKLEGRVSGVLNATFIALIPKESTHSSYNNFHPISLCNHVYKLISKIIASMMKQGLSDGISKE